MSSFNHFAAPSDEKENARWYEDCAALAHEVWEKIKAMMSDAEKKYHDLPSPKSVLTLKNGSTMVYGTSPLKDLYPMLFGHDPAEKKPVSEGEHVFVGKSFPTHTYKIFIPTFAWDDKVDDKNTQAIPKALLYDIKIGHTGKSKGMPGRRLGARYLQDVNPHLTDDVAKAFSTLVIRHHDARCHEDSWAWLEKALAWRPGDEVPPTILLWSDIHPTTKETYDKEKNLVAEELTPNVSIGLDSEV